MEFNNGRVFLLIDCDYLHQYAGMVMTVIFMQFLSAFSIALSAVQILIATKYNVVRMFGHSRPRVVPLSYEASVQRKRRCMSNKATLSTGGRRRQYARPTWLKDTTKHRVGMKRQLAPKTIVK